MSDLKLLEAIEAEILDAQGLPVSPSAQVTARRAAALIVTARAERDKLQVELDNEVERRDMLHDEYLEELVPLRRLKATLELEEGREFDWNRKTGCGCTIIEERCDFCEAEPTLARLRAALGGAK